MTYKDCEVYVECHADGAILSQLLGLSKRKIFHCHGKGKVASYLLKEGSQNKKAMIDSDNNKQNSQTRYFSEHPVTLTQHMEKEDIQLLKDDRRGHIIVVLFPRLEEWLVKSLTPRLKQSLKSQNLPTNAKDLRKFITHENNAEHYMNFLIPKLMEEKSHRLLGLFNLLK